MGDETFQRLFVLRHVNEINTCELDVCVVVCVSACMKLCEREVVVVVVGGCLLRCLCNCEWFL